MLNSTQIRNIEFPKAAIGGYKMQDVDYFLEEVAGIIEGITNENEDLTKKIKVLADKMEEYRNEEEAVKAAILNAQKTAAMVMKEANEKAAKTIKDATSKAESTIKSAGQLSEKMINDATVKSHDMIASAEEKVNQQLVTYNYIKSEIETFKSYITNQYKSQMDMIATMPTYSKPLKSYEGQIAGVVASIPPDDIKIAMKTKPAAKPAEEKPKVSEKAKQMEVKPKAAEAMKPGMTDDLEGKGDLKVTVK